VVVCIVLDIDLVDLFGGGPYPPLYSGGQGYMEILAGYELRSLTQVLSGSFLLLRLVLVVTIGVRCGPCPTPYLRICTLRAQSHGPESNKPPSSSYSSTADFRVLLKVSSSSPELHLEGVFRVLHWLHRGCEVLMPRAVIKSSFIWGAIKLTLHME
jgi:hypothetical protein